MGRPGGKMPGRPIPRELVWTKTFGSVTTRSEVTAGKLVGVGA